MMIKEDELTGAQTWRARQYRSCELQCKAALDEWHAGVSSARRSCKIPQDASCQIVSSYNDRGKEKKKTHTKPLHQNESHLFVLFSSFFCVCVAFMLHCNLALAAAQGRVVAAAGRAGGRSRRQALRQVAGRRTPALVAEALASERRRRRRHSPTWRQRRQAAQRG